MSVANSCEHFFAAMAILNESINSVLPAYINNSLNPFVDMKYVGFGDIVKFRVKPRQLYTVSKGNFRPAC